MRNKFRMLAAVVAAAVPLASAAAVTATASASTAPVTRPDIRASYAEGGIMPFDNKHWCLTIGIPVKQGVRTFWLPCATIKLHGHVQVSPPQYWETGKIAGIGFTQTVYATPDQFNLGKANKSKYAILLNPNAGVKQGVDSTLNYREADNGWEVYIQQGKVKYWLTSSAHLSKTHKGAYWAQWLPLKKLNKATNVFVFQGGFHEQT